MNWGTKLVLGMLVFMTFIISMVVYMFKVHGDDALIEDNYYEKGINYNAEYDAQKNTLDDEAVPEIKITESKLIISLKQAANYELAILRPSAAKKDIHAKGKTVGDANLIIVDAERMDKGLWLLNLTWEANGKKYQFKKELTK